MAFFDSNNKEFSWSNVQAVAVGRNLTKIRGVKYGAKKEKEAVYARGENPHGIQSGNKAYEGEIKLLQSEAETLSALLSPEQDLTDLPPFDLVVSYVPKGALAPLTHICRGVEITEDMREMSQGDKFQEITLPVLFLGITKA